MIHIAADDKRSEICNEYALDSLQADNFVTVRADRKYGSRLISSARTPRFIPRRADIAFRRASQIYRIERESDGRAARRESIFFASFCRVGGGP